MKRNLNGEILLVFFQSSHWRNAATQNGKESAQSQLLPRDVIMIIVIDRRTLFAW